MAHIVVEDSLHKYRLSLSDDTWVCSEGPLQSALIRMLNREAPISRYLSPVYPMPENEATRHAVFHLKQLPFSILTVVLDPPESDPYDPDAKQVVH